MLPGYGWENEFDQMRNRLFFSILTLFVVAAAEPASSNTCEPVLSNEGPSASSISAAARAKSILAMGARTPWTISDHARAFLAVLPDGRKAWGQLTRVLWKGTYGEQALTIRSFSFSQPTNESPPGLFLRGSTFLDEFITSIEDLVYFVLDAYANRRAWPDEFLEQLWSMAFDYLDESTYISTAAGSLKEKLEINPSLERFLKPFLGQLHNASTIRLVAERSGTTIMEKLLNLEISSDHQTLKVEPGNLNILPIASESAKAQLAVGILSTIETLKIRYRRQKIKFVTYTDERALPIYLALGFRKMRVDDFKRLPKNSYRLDSQGFVILQKRFNNRSLINWTPLTCEESDLRSSAWHFIEDFQQKYPSPNLRNDLDQLVSSIELAFKSAPEVVRAIAKNNLDKQFYETQMLDSPLFGFNSKKGFRSIPQLPLLEESEVFRMEVSDHGQRRVGELWLNNGVLEYRVYPWHPFESHDWKVSRHGQVSVEEFKPLWSIRLGGVLPGRAVFPASWIEYAEYEDNVSQPSYMETAWIENLKAVHIKAEPRLASLVTHSKPTR